MSFTNYLLIICIVVANYLGANTALRKNKSLDALFEKKAFQKSGYLPMLNRKVFRGMRVSIMEHPYVVSVRRLTAHYITGTLLTMNVVITVAHPLENVCITELGVVAGENYADRGTMMYTVVLLLFHADFDPYTLAADLVVLRIYEDIMYKVSIKPISLVSSLDEINGQTAFVTGWGRCDRMGKELCMPKTTRFYPREKLDPMLRSIKFVMGPNNNCEDYYQHELIMNSKILCAGPTRADNILCPCMAVPGAPLVVDARLVGMQSWGFGCGYSKDMPVVYTSLEDHKLWLVQIIPVLRSITKQNLSALYQATRVKITIKWLRKARYSYPFQRESRNLDLQPLDIDYKLAKLRSSVYDIRDFIHNGKYHQEKLEMYENIRQSQLKIEDLKKNSLRMQVKVAPFLSNDTLNEAGLVLTNGTIFDNETSNQSEDEETKDDLDSPIVDLKLDSVTSSYGIETLPDYQDSELTE